ncbi:MAG: aminotransferase class I/II-fold pyridoxal phosphate-dependent enzyme, partial [Candidatus Levybacteria bacterium]|nr:aminotransferase class I/II-fold pyridoxal phosphate-dependent enzyme [Candidatus Levybacteria bacterium]
MKTIKQAKRLDLFSEYIFANLARKKSEIEKKTKRKVLNFGPGTPDIKPSNLYIKKLGEFINEDNAHIYPGYGAIKEFSDALIWWYKKRFNVSIDKDELLPLLGAKDGISHLPLALLDNGQEVLIPDPGYPAFGDPALMIG